MKKGIIVGIVIAIIIGVSAVAVSQNDTTEITLDEDVEVDTSEISLDEDVEIEPKSFTVNLEESVGFDEGP